MSQLWERQPIADSPLSVVVLLDNWAADTFHQTLAELQPVLHNLDNQYEVLVPVPAASEAELQSAISACLHSRLVSSDEVIQGQGARVPAAASVRFWD